MACGTCKDQRWKVYIKKMDEDIRSFLMDEGYLPIQIDSFEASIAKRGEALVSDDLRDEVEPFVNRAMERLIPIRVKG